VDVRWDAPIFQERLKLNPWAVPFWADRAKLIAGLRWNVNAISQGGNIETKAWMTRFLATRSEAILAMLLEASDVFDDWNLQTRALAMVVFEDPGIDASRIGVPLLNQDETGGATSNAAIVSTYTNGQFLADFLLLAQASLRGLVFTEPQTFSSGHFPWALICKARYLRHR